MPSRLRESTIAKARKRPQDNTGGDGGRKWARDEPGAWRERRVMAFRQRAGGGLAMEAVNDLTVVVRDLRVVGCSG